MVNCLVFLLLLAFLASDTHAQTVEWLKAGNHGHSYSLAIDREDRIVSGWYFKDSLDLEGHHLVAKSYDLVITRRNKNGELQWIKKYGGDAAEVLTALALDSAQNIYVAGAYYGTTTFGDITLPPSHVLFYNMFVMKLDSNGTVLWAVAPASSSTGGTFSSDDLIVQSDGSCTYTASYNQSVTVGGKTFSSPQFNNLMYVSKLDANGNTLWAEDFGRSFSVQSAAGGSNGNVYLAGSLKGMFSLQGLSAVTLGVEDIMITRFGPDGTLQKLLHIGSPGFEDCKSISVDRFDDLYILGTYTKEFPLREEILPASIYGNTYYAKLDIDGNTKWSKRILDRGLHYVTGTSDANGNSYIAGVFTDSTRFEDTLLLINGSDDALIAAYDKDGTLQWFMRGSGPSVEQFTAVASDGYGAVYFTGYFFQNITIGGSSVQGGPEQAAFTGKIVTPVNSVDPNKHSTLSSEHLTLYPNPAKTSTALQIPQGHGSVVVYNVLGNTVWSKEVTPISSSVLEIQVESWPAGTYFIRSEVEGYVTVDRLTKE